MNIRRNMGWINRNQGGFTAVELLISVVIIGIIGTATAASVANVFSGSSLSSIQMTAINNVRTAGDWITRDAQQAQAWRSSVVPTGTASDTWVTLGATDQIVFVWYEYDANTYPNNITEITVTYTLPGGTTNLTRTEGYRTKVSGVWASSSPVQSQSVVVAQNITFVQRKFIYMDVNGVMDDSNVFTLQIKSVVSTSSKSVEETREFEIRMRPQR